MKFILALTSLILVQADQRKYCEDNGAKKIHHRGSTLWDGDIMVLGDCYNYGEDECPQPLKPPSSYSISRFCKKNREDVGDDITYIWYYCDNLDKLQGFIDLFRSNKWTCDNIH